MATQNKNKSNKINNKKMLHGEGLMINTVDVYKNDTRHMFIYTNDDNQIEIFTRPTQNQRNMCYRQLRIFRKHFSQNTSQFFIQRIHKVIETKNF